MGSSDLRFAFILQCKGLPAQPGLGVMGEEQSEGGNAHKREVAMKRLGVWGAKTSHTPPCGLACLPAWRVGTESWALWQGAP